MRLTTRGFNIYSRPTLGNTRAVVRYLARYTSRIAISNGRITEVDERARTVRFRYTDHHDGAKSKEVTMGGAMFIRAFTRHLVPTGLRRIRYFGFLAGKKGRFRDISGAPVASIGEEAIPKPPPDCEKCGASEWGYRSFFQRIDWRELAVSTTITTGNSSESTRLGRLSLVPPRIRGSTSRMIANPRSFLLD